MKKTNKSKGIAEETINLSNTFLGILKIYWPVNKFKTFLTVLLVLNCFVKHKGVHHGLSINK